MLVLCHGCFDILHLGHVLHLRAARAMGDKLFVSITADKYVAKPGRPVFTQDERLEMLRELRCVDLVIISNARTAANVIRQFKPGVYCKGIDYTDIDPMERSACDEVGALVRFTKTPKYSSTALIA